MNVKQVIETDISSCGMDGEGVARVDGKVVFIPYTLAGERVRAVVKTVKKNYCTASVIKVLRPSEHRVAPACPHYYKCGGCDTLHFDGEYRKDMLVSDFSNNLVKIAGMDTATVKNIRFVGCDVPSRNKSALPFGLDGGRVTVGMYAKNTHDVVPVDCMMTGALAKNVIRSVCDFATENKLSVYDGASGRGLLRHLVVRTVGERVQVVLVINGERLGAENVEKRLCERLPDAVDLFVSPNTRKNNVIMGERVRKLKGNDKLSVDVLGVKAELSPLSFFQVNDEVRDKLYECAIGHIRSEKLIDLYSGIGITSNLAARKCDRVAAVECVPQAVKDADRTAALNGNTDKIRNICGDTEKVIDGIDMPECDVLIDPPRKGAGVAVMKSVTSKRPNRVIYISCNHATMCRDIAPLIAEGYEPVDIAMFDMFCNTHHSEVLVCLQSAKRKL